MSGLPELITAARIWGLRDYLVQGGGEIDFYRWSHKNQPILTCETGIEPDLTSSYLHDPGYYPNAYNLKSTRDMPEGTIVVEIPTIMDIWWRLAAEARAHHLPIERTAELFEVYRRTRRNQFWYDLRAWSFEECAELVRADFTPEQVETYIMRQIPVSYIPLLTSGEVTWVLLRDLFPDTSGVRA